MSTAPTIFWFRRDLRLADNPALVAAVVAGAGDVVPVFVIDPSLAMYAGPARASFLRRSLVALDTSLGGRLSVRVGHPGEELIAVALEVGARSVYVTGDFGPRGRLRDERVASELRAQDIDFHVIDSPYAVKPGTVTTKAGAPCRIFGAFQRGWDAESMNEPLDAPSAVQWRQGESASLDELTRIAGLRRPKYFEDLPDEAPVTLIEAGELAAARQLDRFTQRVDQYHDARNLPGLDATSGLSAHLRFGSLHPRQLLHRLEGATPGRQVFRSELCWREFYADVLYHHPESARQNLQSSLEHLRVDTDDRAIARFHSWARGETGYPLVDAGMRQLVHEGWMHNRVRMVVASFLVKHLHLDWRWGARWFMWNLIDGDLASNQHSWQWVAGTGTDAAPFYRIFNPSVQAARFDDQGVYVHRHIRELACVPAPQCLQPGGGPNGELAGYPAPIIDASAERFDALARYDEARARAQVRA